VRLLIDIRHVFETRGVDRIRSVALIEALLSPDGSFWREWRGPRDDQQPHALIPTELARMLRRFDIHPRTVWSLGGRLQVQRRGRHTARRPTHRHTSTRRR
jgi:hypothetical protein